MMKKESPLKKAINDMKLKENVELNKEEALLENTDPSHNKAIAIEIFDKKKGGGNS
jgi:hypothetical protein